MTNNHNRDSIAIFVISENKKETKHQMEELNYSKIIPVDDDIGMLNYLVRNVAGLQIISASREELGIVDVE